MLKWLAINISTKVSVKITIRKKHVNIDIRWPWIWYQYFYLGIWNDDRTKLIVLPSFQLATRLNSQNRNETVFNNELCHINLYMVIGISNWHNRILTPRIWFFFTLYHFFTRLLTHKYLKLFSTYLVGRNGTMWITCFTAPQNANKENQMQHKNQERNRSLFTVGSWSMKDFFFHYGVST